MPAEERGREAEGQAVDEEEAQACGVDAEEGEELGCGCGWDYNIHAGGIGWEASLDLAVGRSSFSGTFALLRGGPRWLCRPGLWFPVFLPCGRCELN